MTIADCMLGRSRQCKERWIHCLASNIIVDNWSVEEEALLLEKVEEFGRKWRQIEPFLPERPDISLKNCDNVLQRRERKRLKRGGQIPVETEAENPRVRDPLLTETRRGLRQSHMTFSLIGNMMR
jgi:hypothetical protein